MPRHYLVHRSWHLEILPNLVSRRRTGPEEGAAVDEAKLCRPIAAFTRDFADPRRKGNSLNADALRLLSEAQPWSKSDDDLPNEDTKTSCRTPALVICSGMGDAGTFSESRACRTSSGIEESRTWSVLKRGCST